MLVSDLAATFLSWCERVLAPNTVLHYRRNLDAFAAAIGAVQVEDLKPHHLMTWGRTWHQLQAVQRCFAWAADEAELISRNPFARVKRPHLGQRRRILQRVELVRLLRAATPAFRHVLLAARETLARPQELRTFAWEHLDWDRTRGDLVGELVDGRAAFVLEEFKARKRRNDPLAVRVIPISVRLGRLLARLMRRVGSPVGIIFRNSDGSPWSKDALRLRMKRLRNAVGLGPDHRGENVCLYTLRHTGGTEAAAAGVRDRLLAELMGHTSTRTTARYQHLDRGHIADAAAMIAAFRKKKRPGLRRSDDLGPR